MDGMAEYVAVYGVPTQEVPWLMARSLAARVSRFSARQLLAVMDGTAYGAAIALGGGKNGSLRSARDELEREAFPTKRRIIT